MSCDEFSSDNAIPVAAKEQICESDAYILSDVIGAKNGKILDKNKQNHKRFRQRIDY